MNEPLDLTINLREDSQIRNFVIEFDEVRYVLRKHHIKSILEKLCQKGVALSIKKNKHEGKIL